jgi:DNA gyrase/topoisomerase IV subunit A
MQNLNHSIHNQVKSYFRTLTIRHFLFFLFTLTNQQQAILFHLSNLTPRLNKVCLRRENKQSKKEIAELETTIETLRNDLVQLLKSEFKESAKHKRDFTFDINFNNSFDKVQIKSSTVWSPTSPYISSGSFNLDKLSSPSTEEQKQSHYFANGGLGRVNRFEVR